MRFSIASLHDHWVIEAAFDGKTVRVFEPLADLVSGCHSFDPLESAGRIKSKYFVTLFSKRCTHLLICLIVPARDRFVRHKIPKFSL